MKTALIVGNQLQTRELFISQGFSLIYEANKTEKPDLIVFCGGEDVNPSLYGEKAHPKTKFNFNRDVRETSVFERHPNVPKVGICRGAQFLNVCSGGALWQHVEGHCNTGNCHPIVDLLWTRQDIMVSSFHHQVMIPGEDAYVLAAAEAVGQNHESMNPSQKPTEYDAEVVWYPKTRSLCFQPHPEGYQPKDVDSKAQTKYFFDLIYWAFL